MGESNPMLVKGRATKESSQTNSVSRTGEAAILNMPNSLRIGMSLQGQVVSIQGNEIELLLKGNAKIVARLEQNMQVSLNQILNFEVKRADNSLILRPLFENLGQDVNLVKALSDASMPATQENLVMVQSLMQKGMAINKQALNELNRQLTMFPRASGKILVEMKELKIPISEVNVSQFISYKGTNHYLSDVFQGVSSNFQEGLNGMIQEGNEEGLQVTLSKFNQLIFDQQPISSREKVNNGLFKRSNEVLNKELSANIKESIKNSIKENIEVNIKVGSNENMDMSSKSNINKFGPALVNQLNQLELPELSAIKLREAEGNLLKTFLVLEELVKKKEWIPKLKNFFQSDVFQKGVQEVLEERCLLGPKDFGEKEIVKESFTRMKQQAATLQQMSEVMGRAGEQLGATTSSLQNNLEFMNQLNQTFIYLQIPLKNGEHKGNGELFVYAKKKTVIEDGEEISALLHLNMKNIGALDVHVKMNVGKVETKFYLEDESSLDFISSHLSELDAAITKRGYEVNSSIGILEEQKDTLEYLTKREELEGNYIVSNQSFDARA